MREVGGRVADGRMREETKEGHIVKGGGGWATGDEGRIRRGEGEGEG